MCEKASEKASETAIRESGKETSEKCAKIALSGNDCLSVQQAKQISPVTLAFVGDAVYSLFVRERLVLSTDFKSGELQKLTSSQVSAHGQSDKLNVILPMLTKEEEEIYHRGRNAKKATKSKNASVAEYNRSTGFEALIGFLYLTGQTQRAKELMAAGER